MRAILSVLAILAAGLSTIATAAWLLGAPARPALTLAALAIGLAICSEAA